MILRFSSEVPCKSLQPSTTIFPSFTPFCRSPQGGRANDWRLASRTLHANQIPNNMKNGTVIEITFLPSKTVTFPAVYGWLYTSVNSRFAMVCSCLHLAPPTWPTQVELNILSLLIPGIFGMSSELVSTPKRY